MVSSITRQSLGTNRAHASLSTSMKKDVEGGVPVVEVPLEQAPAPGSKLSLFWRRNKKYIIIGGIVLLIVVIVIVVAVVASGGGDESSSREASLANIISTVSTDEALSDKGTPQFKAKDWLIGVDSLKLTPSETVSDQRILQRYALAVFYYATGGPDSWEANSWLTGDECSGQYWTGISCDYGGQVRAMAFGKIFLLFLSSKLEICVHLLTFHHRLRFQDNFGLAGFVPPEIGVLTKLENLILKNHPSLGGKIPTTIGQLSVLGQLGLYDNALTGGIPNELYRATRLNYINLQNNRLEGGLSISIEKLTNLEKIILFNNYFTGGLPFPQFGGTKLKFLGVSNNGFSGTLPDSVSTMSQLEYLYLDGNEFDGLLPNDLGRMTNLSKFELGSFFLTVLCLPHLIPSLFFYVESLNLNDNKFSGTIPTVIGGLRSLEYLSIQSNGLVGQIPSEIGFLTNLREYIATFAS